MWNLSSNLQPGSLKWVEAWMATSNISDSDIRNDFRTLTVIHKASMHICINRLLINRLFIQLSSRCFSPKEFEMCMFIVSLLSHALNVIDWWCYFCWVGGSCVSQQFIFDCWVSWENYSDYFWANDSACILWNVCVGVNYRVILTLSIYCNWEPLLCWYRSHQNLF